MTRISETHIATNGFHKFHTGARARTHTQS